MAPFRTERQDSGEGRRTQGDEKRAVTYITRLLKEFPSRARKAGLPLSECETRGIFGRKAEIKLWVLGFSAELPETLFEPDGRFRGILRKHVLGDCGIDESGEIWVKVYDERQLSVTRAARQNSYYKRNMITKTQAAENIYNDMMRMYPEYRRLLENGMYKDAADRYFEDRLRRMYQ